MNKKAKHQSEATQSQDTDNVVDGEEEEERVVHEICETSGDEEECEECDECEEECDEGGKQTKNVDSVALETENDGQEEWERISGEEDERVTGNKDLRENGNERRLNERSENGETDKNDENDVNDKNVHSTKATHEKQATDPENNAAAKEKTGEEENEVYVDAEEPKENNEASDQSLEFVDEYIELRTPGAKLLDALTPKTRRRRKKQKQNRTNNLNDATVITIDDSQEPHQSQSHNNAGYDVNSASSRSNQLPTTSSEETRPNSVRANRNESELETDNTGYPAQKTAQSQYTASVPPNPSTSVAKSGDDVDTDNQSETSLESQINAANKLAIEREKTGITMNELKNQQSASASIPVTPTSSKTKQAKLTLGGRILKPDTEEESEVSDSEKGAGGSKKKPKTKGKGRGKGKGKKTGNSIPNTPVKNPNPTTFERKLRSQSSTQQ